MQKIIKNLLEEKPVVAKTNKAHSYVPRIDALVEELKMPNRAAPLDTLKKIKDLTRDTD